MRAATPTDPHRPSRTGVFRRRDHRLASVSAKDVLECAGNTPRHDPPSRIKAGADSHLEVKKTGRVLSTEERSTPHGCGRTVAIRGCPLRGARTIQTRSSPPKHRAKLEAEYIWTKDQCRTVPNIDVRVGTFASGSAATRRSDPFDRSKPGCIGYLRTQQQTHGNEMPGQEGAPLLQRRSSDICGEEKHKLTVYMLLLRDLLVQTTDPSPSHGLTRHRSVRQSIDSTVPTLLRHKLSTRRP